MSPATQVVVVADDDRVTRRVLSALLERHGYEVHTAADGDEALTLVKALKPSALFVDAMMPPPDGYEVCARIRADSDLASTQPVIVMVTAAGREADRARAVEAGVDDFVTKPFSPSQLSAKLQQLVEPG